MKRMPLKWKVTLWYAGMLVVLVFLVLGFLLYNSEQMLRSESVSPSGGYGLGFCGRDPSEWRFL